MASKYDELMKSRQYLPFRIDQLSDSLMAKAEKELGETAKVRAETIPALREMIRDEPKLHCPMDDAYLLQYLRARKFNLKKAFNLLQSFYHVKTLYPELYVEADIPLMRRIFKSACIAWLPYRDEEGCPVLMLHVSKWDTDQFTMPDILKALTAVILFGVEDPVNQITGVHIVLDVQGVNLKIFRQLTPRYMHLFSRALRNSLPVRFKGIHIYNEAVLFQYIWKIFNLFLTEKIRNRVHFHGDNQKLLHKFLPRAILPTEYGGDNDIHSSGIWFPEEIERFYGTFEALHHKGYES